MSEYLTDLIEISAKQPGWHADQMIGVPFGRLVDIKQEIRQLRDKYTRRRIRQFTIGGKQMEPEMAISVIDEAKTIYLSRLENCSAKVIDHICIYRPDYLFPDDMPDFLTDIWKNMVIPAIDKVRALDREHRHD